MSEAVRSLEAEEAFEPHAKSQASHLVAPPIRPVRLSSISIDGYGALCDVELEPLGEGVTVVLGPNEAGKSTLFDFITSVLFDFPRRKAESRFRAPVNGGRHGGRVGLVGPDGQHWLVERHVSPQRHLSVTRPDGSPGEEADLRQLLGGAGQELFTSVFAVDLDDLKHLGALSSDEVREVLFSSSILGRRRSAAAAMKELEDRRETLVRPRQGGRANAVASELKEVRTALVTARQAAERFRVRRGEATELSGQVAAVRDRLEATRTERGDLEVLERCWEIVTRRREAESQLSRVEALSAAEELVLERAARLSELRGEMSGHLERLGEHAKLEAARERLSSAIEARCAELGGDWALEWIRERATDFDALTRELRSLSQALGQESAAREAARRQLAETIAEAEAEPPAMSQHTPGPGVAGGSVPEVPGMPGVLREGAVGPVADAKELERRAEHLKLLRTELTELDSLAKDLERDAEAERRERESEHMGEAGRALRILAASCGGAAVLLAVIAVLLVTAHQPALAAVAGVGAVAFAAGGLAASAAARKSAHDTEARGGLDETLAAMRRERAARYAALQARVGAAAGELGVLEPVTPVAVEAALFQVEHLREARRGLDEARQRAEEQRARIARAERAVAARDEKVGEAAGAISRFASSHGLPASLGPDRLAEVIERLAMLSRDATSLFQVERQVDERRAELARFEDDARRLARLIGTPLAGEEEPGAHRRLSRAELEAFFTGAEAIRAVAERRAAARERLTQEIAVAERELDRALGDDSRARELRAELETGRVLEWRRRIETSERALEELASEHETALYEQGRLEQELDALARSSDVPELEQRCLGLEEELRSLMREVVVVSGARFLLQRTLKRYEQERQPAVLERAAQHFARVTDQRYARLAIDVAADASRATIHAVRANGASVDVAALSRGTMEQLYLCLRLGLAESFAERYVPLPIVLDDVLVNFDPERARQVVTELVTTAERHQILLLTCHPPLAELVAGHAPDAKVVELARR